MSRIDVVGARKNNLRDLTVSFERNRITAVTGVSGSGKSSLLQGTLAAEGASRMRTFLGFGLDHLEDLESEAFVGPLPPLLHVAQRGFRASARTTVGTATGILATLRRMFIAAGAPWSGDRRVEPPTPSSYSRWLAQFYQGKATVWAVAARYVATDGVREAERLLAAGIDRVVVRGEADGFTKAKELATRGFKPLRRGPRYLIEAQVGRPVDIGPRDEAAIEQLLDRAFRAGGAVVVELPAATERALAGPWGPRLDSGLHYVMPGDPAIYAPPTNHLLSFNQPEHPESGACPRCLGLGRARDVDVDRLVAHPDRSMHGGAFALWSKDTYRHLNIRHDVIEGLRGRSGFDPDAPWAALSDAARSVVLDGADDVIERDRTTHRALSKPERFEGFRAAILRRAAGGARSAAALEPFVTEGPCPECAGTRWSAAARALRVGGHDLPSLLGLQMSELATVAGSSLARVQGAHATAARLREQADALVSVGLGHLTASRGMTEVSSGESRRARLAAVLNARHAGLCLLLDEPARGLHEQDIDRLGEALEAAAARHTVILNEHRYGVIARAHHVIELGPGAGPDGGTILPSGTTSRPQVALRQTPRHRKHGWLELRGASAHNVIRQDCRVPLGGITCFTGVSGSGKSSLLRGALIPAVARALGATVPEGFGILGGSWLGIEGADSLREIVALDQRPPHPNRRSLVATYIGVADDLREIYGSTSAARALGLSPADFGLNSGAGRCPKCLGLGELEIGGERGPCPLCGGARYCAEALSVRVDGRTIQETLDLSIATLRESARESLPLPWPVLDLIDEVGVGHLALGRRVDTLSGGEIQRLRIAQRLASPTAGATLFALDEPAAGLHPTDVDKLRQALERALDGGRNTVLLVEHNLDIIAQADHVVEVGPGSGPAGGSVLAMGTPAQIAAMDVPTGKALRQRGAIEHPPAPIVVHAQPSLQANRWLRGLLDPALAPEEVADETPLRPAIPTEVVADHERRWFELGDLHLELVRLLIDLAADAHAADVSRLADSWAREPGACLYVQPMLAEMQVWGARIPRSSIVAARRMAEASGLVWHDGARPVDVRARLRPEYGDRGHQIAAGLRRGGGYVELRTESLVAAGGGRLLDLDAGVVAPAVLHPAVVSRLSPRGRCPMCAGATVVFSLDAALVIANPAVPPTDERFLHPSAAEILRGVRRNELIPFLRRLAAEGLWDPDRPYGKLAGADRDVVLHGFWHRPGHGSFLKHAADDPDEVGSWLRWDGLVGALEAQVDRSRDAAWRSAVSASHSKSTCPLCDGTGLGGVSRILPIGETNLHALVRDGDAMALRDHLLELRPRGDRARARLGRLLACIEPVCAAAPSLRLLDGLPPELTSPVVERLAHSYTDMPTVA